MADEADEQKQIDDAERAVEQWKVKKLITTLEAARGSATQEAKAEMAGQASPRGENAE
jgi:hypothetical protein